MANKIFDPKTKRGKGLGKDASARTKRALRKNDPTSKLMKKKGQAKSANKGDFKGN